jgi:branched-chain amino acid transport system substrate-binding protein
MYKIKNLCITGLVVILCLCFFSNIFGTEKYTIGVAWPFTGDSAMFGEFAKEGIELALKEINSEGEIELKAIYLDDKAVPMDAALVAHKFAENKDVIAVIGHFNSSCSIAAAPIYAESNLVMVTSCSTAAKVTQLGLKNVFRTVVTDKIAYTQVANYVIDKLNLKKAAIFFENSDWGRGSLEAFTLQFEKRGGKISGTESFVPNVDKDFSPIVTKFKATDAEVFVVLANFVEAGLVTRFARNFGWDIPIVGGSGLSVQAYIDEATPKFAEGVITFTYFASGNPDPVTQEFIKKYREIYNKEPIDVQPGAYDAVLLIAKAIKQGGNTREKLLEILPSIELKGTSGYIKFDEIHDVPDKSIVKLIVKDGKYVVLGD